MPNYRAVRLIAAVLGLVLGTTSCGEDPIEPGELRFKSVTAGLNHTCALTEDGVAYCWGSNLGGQLGAGNTQTPVAQFTRVATSLRFTSLSAGFRFTCGLADHGAAYCWGENGG